MALPDGKKNFDDMYNRHNTIIATDRRTDGRREISYQYRASVIDALQK